MRTQRLIISTVSAIFLSGAVLAQASPNETAAMIRDAGCRLDPWAFQDMAGQGGRNVLDIQQGVNRLLTLGAARIDPDGAIALEPAYCGLSDDTTVEEVLVAGLRLNGCRATESSAEGLLLPLGLDSTNATPAVEALVARGDARLIDDAVLFLSPELCGDAAVLPALAPVPDTLAAILDLAAANDCQINEETAETGFALLGISIDAAEAVAEEMIAAGQARLSSDIFEVLPPLCVVGEARSPPLASSDPVALRSPDWPAFLALFEAHGCAMAYRPASLVAAEYGLSIRAADTLAENLMDAGLATESGDFLVLDPSLCTAAPDSDMNLLKLDVMVEVMGRNCSASLLELTQWASETGQDRLAAQRAISALLREDRLIQDGLTLVLDHPDCG
jgi:hypothetical protein